MEPVNRNTSDVSENFVDAGLAVDNPDKPDRPVNSPKAVYPIEPAALALLRAFGTPGWRDSLATYLAGRETLASRYAREREQNRIPLEIASGTQITLSPGEHSELIRAVIEDFAPRFAPSSTLVYAGDTGEKWGYFDAVLMAELGVKVDAHGKMPDLVLHYPAKDWLLLVESVISLCHRLSEPRGPGTPPRRDRLGNRSVGGRRAIAPDPFRRRALPRALRRSLTRPSRGGPGGAQNRWSPKMVWSGGHQDDRQAWDGPWAHPWGRH